MLNKIIAFFSVLSIITPVQAEPLINDVPLPPVSFTRVDDRAHLEAIGLDGAYAAWCYDDEANAIIISAPARERAKCELRLMYEMEKQKVKYEFEIDKLKLRIDTLTIQQKEINTIKDAEIERLTKAALKRPNDYATWWATGGVIVGSLITLAIVSVVQ